MLPRSDQEWGPRVALGLGDMGGVSLPHRHPAPPPFFASLPPKQAARKPRGCKDDGGAFPLPPGGKRLELVALGTYGCHGRGGEEGKPVVLFRRGLR